MQEAIHVYWYRLAASKVFLLCTDFIGKVEIQLYSKFSNTWSQRCLLLLLSRVSSEEFISENSPIRAMSNLILVWSHWLG